MGCISLLGGVHFASPGVQMGCNPKTVWGASLSGWGANSHPGVHFTYSCSGPAEIALTLFLQLFLLTYMPNPWIGQHHQTIPI